MASIDRYRPPAREGYQPPSLPSNPNAANRADRHSKSPSKRREVPPAAPSPPTHTSRTSPPRPHSRRSAPSPLRSPSRTPARPQHRQREERTSQWFFTAEELRSTPSIADGLPPAEERLRRAKGVNFIYQAGVLLDLPQITLWVAGVFFHRFYMRLSLLEEKGGIHHYNIAATALFLANKTEENCKKTKDLIIAVAKVAQKNVKLIIDEQSKEYWRWRDNILMYEEMMLELLTFDLMVDNPYQRLYEHLARLDLLHNKRIRDAAWAFNNDACLTPLPLLMDARDISVAAIFFATSVTRERIDDVGSGPGPGEPWWRALGGDEERAVRAIDTMLEFYAENPLRKTDPRYQGSPEFSLESTRRERRGDVVNNNLSQAETAGTGGASSSQYGSPFGGTDRGGTLSPPRQQNGRTFLRKEESDEGASFAEADAHLAHGDSDAVLKAAANDLDVHAGNNPNGNGLRPPAKRKSDERVEDDLDDDNEDRRRGKRRRASDEDGEEDS